MEREDQRGLNDLLVYALMKSINLFSFVIIGTTKSNVYRLKVITLSISFILPSLLFCSSLLILDVGDVSTVCIIEGPKDVVIANNIILVTANGGKIFRVTEAGNLIHFLPISSPLFASIHSLTMFRGSECT